MFEEIYHEYLVYQNELNRKERYEGNEGWYHASGAGLCSRKLYFESIAKVEPTNPPSSKSLRIMRLGTILHSEIQDALIYYNNIPSYNINNKKEKKEINSYKKKKVKFDIEGEITLPSFKVRGFYDVVSMESLGSETEPIVRLHDIKTIGSYPWKLRFSKTKKIESRHHYLQLGTYGLAVREKHNRLDGMSLLYYNKDNSLLKEVEVPMSYIDNAKRYWYSINEEHSKGLPDFRIGTSPVSNWVCNYCQFHDHCQPPILV